MSLIPTALGAMLSKTFAEPLIGRLGYRRTLIGNTVLLGLMIASFALVDLETGRWELMHLKDVRRGTATGPLTGAGHKTVRKVQRSAIPHSMNRRSLVSLGVIATVICALLPASLRATAPPAAPFDRQNFVAWCIVPYDAKKRSPADRAEMLVRLGDKVDRGQPLVRLFAHDQHRDTATQMIHAAIQISDQP